VSQRFQLGGVRTAAHELERHSWVLDWNSNDVRLGRCRFSSDETPCERLDNVVGSWVAVD
jgi:hypothetical protein